MKELSLRALLLGMLLGLVFAVGNAYLGLKVGTTISASIPAAVFAMAILRFSKSRATILENNIVQTVASVGEALAGGAIFTIPALFLIGEHPPISRIFLVSILGGILGVLLMIPMRRYIIVQEHGVLPFPEGTACAEILKTEEDEKGNAFTVVIGMATGALYKVATSIFFLWNEVPHFTLSFLQRTVFSIDCTPSLLGVGYLVGARISAILLAGGVFGWFIFIPLIRFLGTGDLAIYPSPIPVPLMSTDEIWSYYVRYIGIGAVAVGGIFSIFKTIPMLKKTIHMGFKELFQGVNQKKVERVDRDISLRWLVLGSLAIILILWISPGLSMNLLAIFILVILSFFFVAVTSFTVGIVGSTSNPVSGMTITTLLITCLVFLALGWTERVYMISALTIGCVSCTAIALAGTTSQDLKTGYLLGATPRLQQIGEIVGSIIPALAIGSTLYLLDEVYGFGTKQMPAPQGSMLALITKGIMQGEMPFTLVMIGAVLAFCLELIRIPVLPFAIGLYLPLSLSTGMMVGGAIQYLLSKKTSKDPSLKEKGVLCSSGLVAGDAVMGVLIALFTVLGWVSADGNGIFPDSTAFIAFLLLAAGLYWISSRRNRAQK